eukprot:Plantae.Rhodophyta-Hildenbrandia_rubra.ctg17485.p1 GENE.Plantae.Rhodophyta-Hildenbrandia_rubra.ctg17485~~Plantae.Rhodophyta-Hildenbrandia_rubra.ctg17485.p1  ORF type:complete len:751 (-),score=172.01 Plantae.Rhodophyta-Hildenbrandia_rubra.ctg17485:870-3122(-)
MGTAVVPLYSAKDTTAIETILQYISATRGLEIGLLPRSKDDEWNVDQKSEWIAGVVRGLVGGDGGEESERKILMNECFWKLKRELGILKEGKSDGYGYAEVRELIQGFVNLLIAEGKVGDEVIKAGANAICEFGVHVVLDVVDESGQKKEQVTKDVYVELVEKLFNDEVEDHKGVKEIFADFRKKMLNGTDGNMGRKGFKTRLQEVMKSVGLMDGPVKSLERFLSQCNMENIALLSYENRVHQPEGENVRSTTSHDEDHMKLFDGEIAKHKKQYEERLKKLEIENARYKAQIDNGIYPQREDDTQPQQRRNPKLRKGKSFMDKGLISTDEDRVEPASPVTKQRTRVRRQLRSTRTSAQYVNGFHESLEKTGEEDFTAAKGVDSQAVGGLERAFMLALRSDEVEEPGSAKLLNNPDNFDVEDDVRIEATQPLDDADVEDHLTDGRKTKKRISTSNVGTKRPRKQLRISDTEAPQSQEKGDNEVLGNLGSQEGIDNPGILGKIKGLFFRIPRSSQDGDPAINGGDLAESHMRGHELPQVESLGVPDAEIGETQQDKLNKAWEEELGLWPEEGEMRTPNVERKAKVEKHRKIFKKGTMIGYLDEEADIEILPTPKRRRIRRRRRNHRFTHIEDRHMHEYLETHGFGDWAGMLRDGQEKGLYDDLISTQLKDRARTKKWTKADFPLATVVNGRGLPPGGLRERMRIKKEEEEIKKEKQAEQAEQEGPEENEGKQQEQEQQEQEGEHQDEQHQEG